VVAMVQLTQMTLCWRLRAPVIDRPTLCLHSKEDTEDANNRSVFLFVRSFDLLVGVLCVSVAEMKMKFVAEDDREDKA
jgi:hypothetical protein